jgi:hypothetical protein
MIIVVKNIATSTLLQKQMKKQLVVFDAPCTFVCLTLSNFGSKWRLHPLVRGVPCGHRIQEEIPDEC